MKEKKIYKSYFYWGIVGFIFLFAFYNNASALSLNIPNYDTTFDDSFGTRGFWFTAPVNFIITGLRVPTDIGMDGPQNIELLRLNSPPPIFSESTNDFTSVFYARGIDSPDFIATHIKVAEGDIIGILGARGITEMHNSYSAHKFFNSAILGEPIVLKRFLFQDNLYNTHAYDVSTDDWFISRIELNYAHAPEPASLFLFGFGLIGLVGVRRKLNT
jgi:hypothetical protein